MAESPVTEQDQLLIVNSLLPLEVGLFRQKVVYTCLHVEDSILAVGSENGSVWVLDTSTNKIIKEISESKASVKLVKLSSNHSFIAIGFSDGVLAVLNYLKPSVKRILKEKGRSAITAFTWTNNGDGFIFGCYSGKLLSATIDRDKGQVEVSDLLDCGSEVVQLSLSGSLLVISSQERSLLLNVDTGQLTQIGLRERKLGSYGGCFISEDSMMIARPGLRIWITATDGKVQSTAKFKDALSEDLAAMALFGGITMTTVVSDGMQFSVLVPWINQWVVCYHGNTVFVLDPSNLKCIGVMSIGQQIIDLCTHKKDVYMLVMGHQRLIIKLSLSTSEPKKTPIMLPSVIENTDAPNTVKDDNEQKDIADDDIPATLTKDEQPEAFVQENSDVVVGTAGQLESVSTDVLKNEDDKEDDQSENVIEEEKKPEEKGAKKVLSAVESRLQQVSDLKGIILSNPLGKLTSARHESPKEEEKPKDEPLHNVPLSTIEAERRMQMLKVEDEDGVSVRANTSKKKKKRKPKKSLKLTPLSSTHSSLEALNNLVEETVTNGGPTTNHDDNIPPAEQQDKCNSEPLTPKDGDTEIKVPDIQQSVSEFFDPSSTQTADMISSEKIDETETCDEPEQTERTTTITTTTVTSPEELSTDVIVESETEITPSNSLTDTARVGVPSPSSSNDLKDESEEDLLSNLNKIWSAEDHVDSIDITKLANKRKQDKEGHLLLRDQPLSRDQPLLRSRSRANAVFIDQDKILFQPTTKNELFSDDSSHEDPSFTFLNEMDSGNNDATLTRSSVKPTYDRDQTKDPLLTSDSTSLEAEQLARSRQSSHSHSISSSYSMEEITSNHPLHSGASDSETEDDEDTCRTERHESVIASDYYSLVDELANQTPDCSTEFFGKRGRAEAFVPPVQEEEDTEGLDPPAADSWQSIPQPSRHAIQSVCLSSTSLWLINARSCLFWSHSSNKGQNWQGLKKHISHISSSADGVIVWGVYHHQAYVRRGISHLNPAGSSWFNITRNASVSRKIKCVSCDFNAVWAITTDGRMLFRRGVCEEVPEGKVWIEAKSSITFVQVSSCGGIVWALDVSGRAFVREDVRSSFPAGTKWRDVNSPHFTAVSVLENGLVWGIDVEDRLWFKCGATAFEPEGSGHWFEVTIGSLSKPTVSGLVDAVWKVRSIELRSNSFLHSVTSRLVHSTSNKFIALSACNQSGICLLTSDNELHACWNPVTGYHRQPASTDPLFSVSVWKQCAAFNNVPWAIREDGELFCFPSSGKSLRVECQEQVRVLSASPSAVWALTQKDIWSRQGICDEIPQGYSWEYIELGSHMQGLKIKQLAIGNNVAWAVDNHGKLHFRFGIHPREPGTGMAPAWIEVPDQEESHLQSSQLTIESIVVSPDDWLVWILDQNGCPYARKGVTPHFPVGRYWEPVKGEKIKALAAGSSKIFAISANGDLLRRKPITEGLPAGIYWRKLPGKFDILSASPLGDLWLIGEKGVIMKQKPKVVMVNPRKEKEALEECYEEEWDVL